MNLLYCWLIQGSEPQVKKVDWSVSCWRYSIGDACKRTNSSLKPTPEARIHFREGNDKTTKGASATTSSSSTIGPYSKVLEMT